MKKPKLLNDRKGVSVVILELVMLLIAGSILAFALYNLNTGSALKERPLMIQLSVSPDTQAGYAFIIKNIGTDSISLSNMRLIVYNATSGKIVYSQVVSDDLSNFTHVSIYGEKNKTLNPHELLKVKSTVIRNTSGTYTIKIIHETGKWTLLTDTLTLTLTTNTLTPTPTATTPSAVPTQKIEIAYINYDAPGDDWNNPNGEYVIIENNGTANINLKGWKLMDEIGRSTGLSSHIYTFPDITLKPGDTVYIHSGTGTDHDHVLYWGKDIPIWNNDGDTAYLYDPNGKLVDTYTY